MELGVAPEMEASCAAEMVEFNPLSRLDRRSDITLVIIDLRWVYDIRRRWRLAQMKKLVTWVENKLTSTATTPRAAASNPDPSFSPFSYAMSVIRSRKVSVSGSNLASTQCGVDKHFR